MLGAERREMPRHGALALLGARCGITKDAVVEAAKSLC